MVEQQIKNETFVATLKVEQLKQIFEEVIISTANAKPNYASNVSEKGEVIKGIRQLASYIGCGLNTAQKLKNEGKIPFSQYGNRLLFYSNEIDNALKMKDGQNGK
jgi:excisionase family DNA binding protein